MVRRIRGIQTGKTRHDAHEQFRLCIGRVNDFFPIVGKLRIKVFRFFGMHNAPRKIAQHGRGCDEHNHDETLTAQDETRFRLCQWLVLLCRGGGGCCCVIVGGLFPQHLAGGRCGNGYIIVR